MKKQENSGYTHKISCDKTKFQYYNII